MHSSSRRMVVGAACVAMLGACTSSETGGPAVVATADVTVATAASDTTTAQLADSPIHVVSVVRGTVTVSSLDGADTATYDLPEGFSALSRSQIGRWLIDDQRGADALRAVDLRSGELHSVALPFPLRVNPLSIHPGTDVVVLDAGDVLGGVALADLSSGEVTSLVGPDDRFTMAPSSHGVLLYRNGLRTRSLIVPLAEPTTAYEIPASALDATATDALGYVSDGTTGWMQHFHDGVAVGNRVALPTHGVGAILAGDGALVVDESGTISRGDFADGTLTEVGQTGFPLLGLNPVGNGNAVAWSQTDSVVLGPDGAPLDKSPAAGLRLLPVTNGSRCATLQSATMPKLEGAHAVLIDLSNGAPLHEFDATPTALTDDGCSLLASGTPSELVVDGALVDTGLNHVQAVADGFGWVIGSTADDRSQLLLAQVPSGVLRPLPKGVALFAEF